MNQTESKETPCYPDYKKNSYNNIQHFFSK